MADIFISYAHKDGERCDKIVKILQERGWDIWHDVHNLRPLENFTEEIAAAMDISRSSVKRYIASGQDKLRVQMNA